ncbi:hypothetical protein LTR22_023142 [Elasticomyces elasticus]|nr:hypothetical protein LTR22_023142 [Elasticomyces elasticus]KAK4912838.1 hypothetical protein LTR49_018800 [Elasticomyces elasticus]
MSPITPPESVIVSQVDELLEASTARHDNTDKHDVYLSKPFNIKAEEFDYELPYRLRDKKLFYWHNDEL